MPRVSKDAPFVPPCALEDAAVHSKIVVVREAGVKCPILMTPDGAVPLDPTDVAWSLPEGARIEKRTDGYAGRQLDHNRAVDDLIGNSAREVIAGFHQHFHG